MCLHITKLLLCHIARLAAALISVPHICMRRHLFAQDYPHHASRFRRQLQLSEWPEAYRRRRRTEKQWAAGPCASTELKAHTGVCQWHMNLHSAADMLLFVLHLCNQRRRELERHSQ